MSMSMMGSGIYSITVTRDVECIECEDCAELGQTCNGLWVEDFETDDWGRVCAKVVCPDCHHDFYYEEGR